MRTAIEFVVKMPRRFNIDPNQIAIVGESASGQMVAQTAVDGYVKVKAVVCFYGVYDFLPMAGDFSPRSIPVRLFGLTEKNDYAINMLRRFSPITGVHGKMPPILLIQGTADRLHSQAVAFQKELVRVKADHEVFDVTGAPHGVENWEGHAEWLGYKTELVEWLRAKLK